jgi:cardiolipin synthase
MPLEPLIPVNLPNLITIARILLVPVTVWLIITGSYGLAFLAFLAAGISDGIDGAIARRFGLKTELGAYLDPIADKGLLGAIYITLGILGDLPAWLVIAVVTRDVLIVGGVMLAWVVDKPMAVRPSLTSKVNTAAQIIFAGLVMLALAVSGQLAGIVRYGGPLVALSTFLSGAFYMRDWIRHMTTAPEGTS